MAKCVFCNKRTHITFSCKCELIDLCIKCKTPEDHKCNFDYKEEQKNKLKEENPQVIKDKISRM